MILDPGSAFHCNVDISEIKAKLPAMKPEIVVTFDVRWRDDTGERGQRKKTWVIDTATNSMTRLYTQKQIDLARARILTPT